MWPVYGIAVEFSFSFGFCSFPHTSSLFLGPQKIPWMYGQYTQQAKRTYRGCARRRSRLARIRHRYAHQEGTFRWILLGELSLLSMSAGEWQVETLIIWWKVPCYCLRQEKGSFSAPLPHRSPLRCRWEEYMFVCVCSVARCSSLSIKAGAMKNIFLLDAAVIYVKYFWVGTESSTPSFGLLFFIYFNSIVFMAMSTSFAAAPDSEVMNVSRTGEQSSPMAAHCVGPPDLFPYSYLSPLSILPVIHKEQLQYSLLARREDRQTAVTLWIRF